MHVLSDSDFGRRSAQVLDRMVRLSRTCLDLERRAMCHEEAGQQWEAELFYDARNRTSRRMSDLFALFKELQ